MTTRRPRSSPLIAAAATCAGVRHSGFGSPAAKSWAPDASWKPDLTGPGHSAVTETPLPLTSWCRPFREHQREALDARVERVPGQRLEAGGRGRDEHRAPPPLDHARQVARGEVDHGLRVDARLLDQPPAVDVRERVVRPESRVVGEHVDAQP